MLSKDIGAATDVTLLLVEDGIFETLDSTKKGVRSKQGSLPQRACGRAGRTWTKPYKREAQMS